jgi:peptidoglycan/xylan/chitin deacetylase (PgdA/CDA1 family)
VTTPKSLLKRAVASSFGWPIASRWLKAPGVTVLMYHRVTPPSSAFDGCPVDTFREQMQWLKHHCLPIGPDQLLQHTRESKQVRPPVVVTFDDGFRDYFDHAYPILKELDIPAVVFLATSFVDAGGMIWTDEVTWAIRNATSRPTRLPWSAETVFDFTSPHDRSHFEHMAKLHLKSVPNAERKEKLAQLFKALVIPPAQAQAERQMLNWDEVRATLGLTTFGGHSHTHPIMSQLDEVEADAEIRTCRERLLAETGQAPKYFAYPNGRRQDFNDTTKRLLKYHGFELAFSTIGGINDRNMDTMAIKRIHGGNGTPDMACLIAGISRV